MGDNPLAGLVAECPSCSKARALLAQLRPELDRHDVALVGRPKAPHPEGGLMPMDGGSLRIGCGRCGGHGRILTDAGRLAVQLLHAQGVVQPEGGGE